ncbi:MAG: GtrA family protein [Pseudomonadota bacterium]|nr:GtrA family protein [Pseudomonadota bacterium]
MRGSMNPQGFPAFPDRVLSESPEPPVLHRARIMLDPVGSLWRDRSFIRYLCVGLINTCVGLSTIYAGIYVAGFEDVPANAIGYGVGMGCSFLLNRYWTFDNQDGAHRQLPKFLLIMGCAYLVNLATVMTLIKFLGVPRSIAHAAGVVPYTLAGYLGNRFFAFRRRPRIRGERNK